METGRLFSFFGPSVRLTALFDCHACLGKLDKDNVAEAFLRIVRDGHRADSTLVVKRDHLVIWRVSFRWRRKASCSRTDRRAECRGLTDNGAPERERNG